MNLEPFTSDHLDGAAMLLAARHARQRAAEPLLPARFEKPAAAGAEIVRLLDKGAEGLAATRGGHLTAYILGTRDSDSVWGPNVWVELAGHAAEQAEDVRDAYAAAAASWVDAGRKAHYAVVPASDAELVDAWFRLGFGQQHAYGIRDVPPERALPPGVRVAERADVDALVALAPLLSQHQALAPVFSAGPSANQTDDEIRSDIEQDFDDPAVGNLVAEVGGRIVGNFVVVPVEASSMHVGLARADGAAYLAWAATLPEVRGTGSGRALTEAAFAWARARGYEVMVTDWRVTNLLSSRFWPARGFRPTLLRLHRLLA
jgi:GNAT superfamily N-acetyltransferase